nr:immunoglobulin light chain junction region [Macaca mulatta]MOX25777.1 immunoglobulin light chain junction region [Macaca mulatta]
CMQALEFPCTF